MKNQDSTTATFGWIITFSGLTGAAYDLSVLSGSTTTVGSWSVTTGTGDTDIEAYGINSGTNIYSDVQSFTNVAPVAGVITLTSTADANEFTFRNAYIAAATITLVPEPGSLALLGLGALCVLRRRGA